ncbi:hypothetical protein BOW53_02955 [Solemya pervernicosa gill symbiont]|uniref:Uncharacterized protein n=1 Tax=Solemya pervernicosa gill symbiont TaxID=642797 RepID=A0A1T2L981_9GAMM|nr:hypothetical protein [Solemya pervernicosa gill symbiont]OOZ41653.1 hypothetical protein BOW53_02955 [Solemya pervernicosa gill symbiont]
MNMEALAAGAKAIEDAIYRGAASKGFQISEIQWHPNPFQVGKIAATSQFEMIATIPANGMPAYFSPSELENYPLGIGTELTEMKITAVVTQLDKVRHGRSLPNAMSHG